LQDVKYYKSEILLQMIFFLKIKKGQEKYASMQKTINTMFLLKYIRKFKNIVLKK